MSQLPVAYEIFRLLINNLLIERLERLLEKNYDVSERIEIKNDYLCNCFTLGKRKRKSFHCGLLLIGAADAGVNSCSELFFQPSSFKID